MRLIHYEFNREHYNHRTGGSGNMTKYSLDLLMKALAEKHETWEDNIVICNIMTIHE